MACRARLRACGSEGDSVAELQDGYSAIFGVDVPYIGEILSCAYEPAPGWSGRLAAADRHSLVFETEITCKPILPTLLPLFMLLAPSDPDFPGAMRVSWKRSDDTPSDRNLGSSGTRWMPHELVATLSPGVTLRHTVERGVSVWRLGNAALFIHGPAANRPRLVLAPPRRRERREIRRAIISSLNRTIGSAPPDRDFLDLAYTVHSLLGQKEPNGVTELLSARSASGAPHVAALVGYGSGVPPLGDDFLVGLLCGMDLASAVDGRTSPERYHLARSHFVRTVHSCFEHTTLLGRQLLTAAFHGLYSAPLLDVADALADGVIIAPGESPWNILRRPRMEPGWPARLGLAAGAFLVISNRFFMM
jgi:Protein of unknown function (DUF2877)